MFVISQFALHKSNMCKFNNISTYAIASGLVVYASIYLYLLFYNNDYVALFNKFIIYIIGIDLLLSTFYYFNTSKKPEQEPQSHNLNFEKNPNVELLNVPNVINVSSVSNDDSDEESISNDEESDFEIEETEDYDMEEMTKTEILEQLQTVDTEQLQTVDTEQLQQTLEKINSEETKQEMQKKVQRVDSDKINLSEKKLVELESEQVIKKKRGRKPNHLKIQGL